MRIDDKGNLVHEVYDSKFSYRGSEFIVDNHEGEFIITERNFMVKSRGCNLNRVKAVVMSQYDEFLDNAI